MNVFLWNARARNGHVEATSNHPFPAQVADVRATGLMIGVEFADAPGLAAAVAKHCQDRGLLVLPTGVHQAVRLIPPLTVSRADLAEGLATFAEAVHAAAAEEDLLAVA